MAGAYLHEALGEITTNGDGSDGVHSASMRATWSFHTHYSYTLIKITNSDVKWVTLVATSNKTLDTASRKIMRALDRQPRGTVGWLAQTIGYARGTVQQRLATLFEGDRLRLPSTLVHPALLGYAVRAVATAEVVQSDFDSAVAALKRLPEVIECFAVAGERDLVLHLVAVDADDLYRVTQEVLRCPGIGRTATSLALRELIPYRVAQLIDQAPTESTAN